MINEVMQKRFEQMKHNMQDDYVAIERKIHTISSLRVISFCVGIALFFVGVGDGKLWAGILGTIFLLAFFGLIVYHSKVYREYDELTNKLLVVDAYLKRFDDGWRQFDVTGKEYISADDTVVTDLDLLGDNSLYQLINVTHTDMGKAKLADTLKLESVNPDTISLKQDSVKELIDKTDFAVEFESAGIKLAKERKKADSERFTEYCEDEKRGILPMWANFLRIAAPVIMLVLITLWIAGFCGYGIPLIGFIVFLSVSWLTKTVTDSVIMPLFGMNYSVNDYLRMLNAIHNCEFKSEYLLDIKSRVSGEYGTVNAFDELKAICQAYNVSYNPLIHQVLSGVILWDYQLAHRMEVWKKKYGLSVSKAFSDIATMEELLSLSVVGVVRKSGWGDIDFSECESVRLECKNLYHPLISPLKVVANSKDLQSGITIITGSNMSGKTTFLRTVAINLALAYIGAPICGEYLNANYMKIFTSMRVTDDVANGISTFYAEILRIKAMAEYKLKKEPMLCLIDEIFKGTNSADRIVGATEAIKQLSGDKCMTVVSTHDFELCGIKDSSGKDAQNYHFEEYYENGNLRFDYKIKDGRCTTTNARELLKMAGFSV